jgi:hypothetical protein
MTGLIQQLAIADRQSRTSFFDEPYQYSDSIYKRHRTIYRAECKGMFQIGDRRWLIAEGGGWYAK